MLSEKIIRKMRSNSVDVFQWHDGCLKDNPDSGKNREIYELFYKTYVLLSIILEDVYEDDNEREIRGYEHKSGQDWLDFLPYNYKNKNKNNGQ